MYRYNLTSGQVYENNGEKQRGGAGCGCVENTPDNDGRAIWAGGFSDAGLTDDVESWGVAPAFHRGGEPVFSCTEKRRDVGATVCGGLFVVAGGSSSKMSNDDSDVSKARRRKHGPSPSPPSGKGGLTSIDIFNATSATGGKPIAVQQLDQGLVSPVVACLGDRYAVITGGLTGSSCNNRAWVLDTQTGAFNASTLLLPTAGAIAVASDGTGTAMFFDGTTGDVWSLDKGGLDTATQGSDVPLHRRRKGGPPSPPGPTPKPGPVEPKAIFDGKV